MDKSKSLYNDGKYYINRELSWLDFDYRVLAEAKNPKIPLFERMKFLSITASNLDEFFMIRVASLKDMVHAGYDKPDISGMTPKEQLAAINEKTHRLVTEQYNTYNRALRPKLKACGLKIVRAHEKLTEAQAEYVDKYFDEIVYPVLTPMAVDSSRPFPLIRNNTLNIGAMIESGGDLKDKADRHRKSGEQKNKKRSDKEELEFVTVQVPSVLPRFVQIPGENKDDTTVILLEEIIERHIDRLFMNHKVVCAHPYRVMRNADLTIDEEDAADLLKEIEKQLKKRQWGEVIRLEVEENTDKRLLKKLKKELEIEESDVYKIKGPIDLTFLMKLYGLEGFDNLKEEKYVPVQNTAIIPEMSIFDCIKNRDILLNHPYEKFDPVVDFVKEAARDKDVLAIKQTLYRVSGNSPIIESLAKAAENGKQVTVLVELKARFDEENNINWARRLEKAGCHVIYGLRGLKTHSKITLVVRKEGEKINRYVHLGTGNYNDATAKLYTDMGLLTCNEAIGEDATAVFNMLSGYSEPEAWNKLAIAPLWLRDKFYDLIDREIKFAKAGKKAQIKAKMNSLCDKGIISKLYEAGQAGVKIQLIVRGICCLRAGVKSLSENISVRSIVGTFLEHGRIFYFYNGGKEEVYMGSADWMPRNLDKRVEITFPVEDKKLKKEIIHILDIQLNDNVKASEMQADGSYKRVDGRGKKPLNSQMYFCREAVKKASKTENDRKNRGKFPMSECVDLHVHSTASDGTLSPAEVVHLAKNEGLFAIALTDHDTVGGLDEAVKAGRNFGIKVIPGIEISAEYEGRDLHILGYNIDYKNPEFKKIIESCQNSRLERNMVMCEKIKDLGIDITWEKFMDKFGDTSITRAHFAKYMVDCGFVDSTGEAFTRYLNPGCPCYVPRKKLTPQRAIDIIKLGGGHAVLAHPLLYGFSEEKLLQTVKELKGCGLEGIEALYSLNSPEDDIFLQNIAKDNGLFITGGSDFHGEIKPDISIGLGKGRLRVSPMVLDNIENH